MKINGMELDFDTVEAGDMIIKAAQGVADEKEMAEWLWSPGSVKISGLEAVRMAGGIDMGKRSSQSIVRTLSTSGNASLVRGER